MNGIDYDKAVFLDPAIPTWASIPSAAMVESPPGVAVFDTTRSTLIALPLD